MALAPTSEQSLHEFVAALSAKQATPGGGAAAAVGAAIGAAAATMAANYTQRKKDIESGAAQVAQALATRLNAVSILTVADDDATAYADLQRSWKASEMTCEEKAKIEANALAVPVSLVELSHEYVMAIHAFLPSCNDNITSDAKVGIHLLAGAARSAYQTVLVNRPPEEERQRLKVKLDEIRKIEDEILA
mmetsp:Transcript_53610/g.83500  ORF Transcript_53610/g.83500 Transcript_53610/m.83500 type:complete len:191 (+) Transcript_53610:111-683(+)